MTHRTFREAGLLAILVVLSLVLSSCVSQNSTYEPVEALAKSIKIGSITKVLARETYGTGKFSSPQPTLEVAVTGRTKEEQSIVEHRLQQAGFKKLGQIWDNGDYNKFKSVAIVPISAGDSYTFTASHHRQQFPSGGLVYVVVDEV